MKRRALLALASALPAAPALARLSHTLLVAGSPAVADLMTALGEAFRAVRPDVSIWFEPGGNASAMAAAQNGATDLAALSTDLPGHITDGRWHAHLFARTGLRPVIHPSVGLETVGATALRNLALGRVANWQEIGGPDLPVRPVLFQPMTMQRRQLDDLLPGVATARTATAGNAADMAAAVMAAPGGIGFLGPDDPPGGTRPLACDGVPMTRATLLSGRYPLTLSAFLVVFGRASDLGEAFIAFARGPAGQRLIAQKRFIRVR